MLCIRWRKSTEQGHERTQACGSPDMIFIEKTPSATKDHSVDAIEILSFLKRFLFADGLRS
jgi:hypothetical protein